MTGVVFALYTRVP